MDHDLVFIRNKRHLPQAKNLQPGLCNYPSKVINIDSAGRIFVCLCEAWLPYSIGHVMEFETLEQVFDHPQTINIQQSQQQGQYQYCDTESCNLMYEKRIQDTIQIYIGIDDSCQLSCASCRSQVLIEKNNAHKLAWIDRITSWLANTKAPKVDVLIGSRGDPFASPLYRKILAELGHLQLDSRIEFQLKTNGLLIQRYLAELDILPKINQLEISIDAGTENTYHMVRQPAKWSVLLDNLEYCLHLRQTQHAFPIRANFVVQKNNFKEMLAFVELCRKYIMIPNFTVLQDWNTFVYKDHAVHLQSHPQHKDFIHMIQHQEIKPFIGRKFDHWYKS